MPSASSWSDSRRPIAGFWAKSIEPGDAGDANAHVTAIGKDTPLVKSLCIPLPGTSQDEPDERLGTPTRPTALRAASASNRVASPILNRVMHIVCPMKPSDGGWLMPDTYLTKSMADMSLQVAGTSWDGGAGKIPDSMLTYFNTEAGYPTVAARSRGLLIMNTSGNGIYGRANGDTVLR